MDGVHFHFETLAPHCEGFAARIYVHADFDGGAWEVVSIVRDKFHIQILQPAKFYSMELFLDADTGVENYQQAQI